jgi:hypothetical protein
LASSICQSPCRKEEEGEDPYLADVMAKLDAVESKEEKDSITATVAEAEALEEVLEKDPDVAEAMIHRKKP